MAPVIRRHIPADQQLSVRFHQAGEALRKQAGPFFLPESSLRSALTTLSLERSGWPSKSSSDCRKLVLQSSFRREEYLQDYAYCKPV